jgi:uncharacterized protein (TIGR02453 family)
MNEHTVFSGFPQETLQFWQELAANNNREWFKAHEQQYRNFVLAPAQAFVIDLGERLKAVSPGITYDPQTNGRGSIMRIHRDIRFSPDKTPYNTHLRIHFDEGKGKLGETPGYFFRMNHEGAELFGGQYLFAKPELEAYRAAVVDEKMGKALEDALAVIRTAGNYEIGGEHYKRVPAGYPAEHERATLLRHNGLYVTAPKIGAEMLLRRELVDVSLSHCQNMAAVHHWLVRLFSNATD